MHCCCCFFLIIPEKLCFTYAFVMSICLVFTLSSSFKKACGEEGEKEEEYYYFWHSLLTYVALLAIRPGRNQDSLRDVGPLQGSA